MVCCFSNNIKATGFQCRCGIKRSVFANGIFELSKFLVPSQKFKCQLCSVWNNGFVVFTHLTAGRCAHKQNYADKTKVCDLLREICTRKLFRPKILGGFLEICKLVNLKWIWHIIRRMQTNQGHFLLQKAARHICVYGVTINKSLCGKCKNNLEFNGDKLEWMRSLFGHDKHDVNWQYSYIPNGMSFDH